MIKCKCNVCDQKLEFDNGSVGQTTECPTCGNNTILYNPMESSKVNSKLNLKMIVLLSILYPIAGWMWYSKINKPLIIWDEQYYNNITTNPVEKLSDKPFLMTTEEKNARDNILKSIIDLNSSTSVGVNFQSYGDLLKKSVSVYEFESIKLDYKRNEKFLISARKTLAIYKIVYDEWNDYFKYDWMRNRNVFALLPQRIVNLGNTLEIQTNILFSNSVLDLSSSLRLIDKDIFISAFWNAAELHIEDLKEMSK